MDCAQLANTAASALVALCCTVFAIVYHRHAPWRSTSVGRHVMLFTIAIGLLTLYTVLVTIWPTGPTTSVLRFSRTLLLLLIASLVVQRTHMVLRAQRQGVLTDTQHDHPDPPHDDSSN
ncbi:putative phage holin [Streptomyces griseorubiginosus]|uniref:putative phage holin n=1 Tax=Streptomyces griseorubiginosus TaxID=67304 RepID=UPI00332DA8FA